MLDHDLTTALLCHLNRSQSALGITLEELAIWAKHCEGGEAYGAVINHLQTLERNADFVAETIVVLTVDHWSTPGPYGRTSLRDALGTAHNKIFKIFSTRQQDSSKLPHPQLPIPSPVTPPRHQRDLQSLCFLEPSVWKLPNRRN